MRVRVLLSTALTATLSVVLVGVTGPAAEASVGTGPLSCAQADGRVSAIEIAGGVAYIGGSFTHVTTRSGSSQSRGHLAAIDTQSCDLLPWTADTNDDVEAITVSGGTVYVGGDFTTISDAARSRLAAVSAATGAATPFNPSPNATVLALTTSGGNLYAGGEFTSMGGTQRGHLAAFSPAGGGLTSWAPSANNKVFALVGSPDGSRVYAGGSFTAIGGNTQYRYAVALDPSSGSVDTGFSPAGTVPILDLAVDSGHVYAAGGGGGGRLLVWRTTGALDLPVFRADGNVQAVATGGGSVYAGGHFNTFCTNQTGRCQGPARRKLFEVSLSSGSVTSWAPSLNSALGVWAATVDPATGRLWVGGDFTKVGTTARQRLAVFPPS